MEPPAKCGHCTGTAGSSSAAADTGTKVEISAEHEQCFRSLSVCSTGSVKCVHRNILSYLSWSLYGSKISHISQCKS